MMTRQRNIRVYIITAIYDYIMKQTTHHDDTRKLLLIGSPHNLVKNPPTSF
ncbi:hypothetical protein HanPSC8_Chr15g0647711 [Helianthus annuus]|nr:hypothetical protein HanPSC8_Chr15g0647711 [Helianthus annuus]